MRYQVENIRRVISINLIPSHPTQHNNRHVTKKIDLNSEYDEDMMMMTHYRITLSQKIYSLHGLKHRWAEIGGDVTDTITTNKLWTQYFPWLLLWHPFPDANSNPSLVARSEKLWILEIQNTFVTCARSDKYILWISEYSHVWSVCSWCAFSSHDLSPRWPRTSIRCVTDYFLSRETLFSENPLQQWFFHLYLPIKFLYLYKKRISVVVHPQIFNQRYEE